MYLTNQINEHLVNPKLVGERNRTAHYPSEASIISRTDGCTVGKCHRAAWYSWKGHKPTNPIDARGMWTFRFGNELEAMYIGYTKEIGIWVADHVKFYDRIRNVSGEVDLFISKPDMTGIPKDGELVGVELKSAYGWGFQNKIKKFPKIENLLQVALYLDNFPVKEWRLVYHSRDTMENIEYGITIGEDKDKGKFLMVDSIPVRMFYLDDIYDRYRELGEYVIKNELPPRDYTYAYSLEQSVARCNAGTISKSKLSQVKNKKATDSDWRCLYCGYLDECWKERRKEVLSG